MIPQGDSVRRTTMDTDASVGTTPIGVPTFDPEWRSAVSAILRLIRCFGATPAGTRQGPHVALTAAELLTIRLGAMGPFGE
jgi:hypothetical protein